jgi:hypothetical protein
MSAIETTDGRVQDKVVEHVASVTALPSRVTPDPAPVVPLPSLAQVFDFVTPPDIWSDDRPSLRKLWLYGVYGRWTAATGPVRVAGAVYATTVAFPLHAALYLALWIAERPSRLLVAAVITALAILVLN